MIAIFTPDDLLMGVKWWELSASDIERDHLTPSARVVYDWAEIALFVKDRQVRILKPQDKNFPRAKKQVEDILDVMLDSHLGEARVRRIYDEARSLLTEPVNGLQRDLKQGDDEPDTALQFYQSQ